LRGFSLIIAGKSERKYLSYETELKNLVQRLGLEEKVKFIGHIEGREKDKLIAESYVLVLPSHSENFGMVVVEALAQGTPVIASKGTPWEELESYKAGYWVQNSPQSLAKALDDILSLDTKKYKELTKNSLRLAQKYDIRKNINLWIEFYKGLLKVWN
jgi:glycosyltransferase involved in cell wall biosynthesis